MGREVLLERMKEVVEKEGSARESAKMFAYEVLPSLLDNLPDDFVGFLLGIIDAGYAPVDWTYYFYMNTHFLWLSKGDYDMRIEWVDYDWLKEHPDVEPCPQKPRVTLSPRKCPHIMVEAYYRDANIGDMERALEERLKNPQNAECV